MPDRSRVIATLRWLEMLPIFITMVAVLFVLMFLFRGERVAARIGPEVFTQTYQFLLMIVIGSGVSVLFQSVSYAREARERRRTLQREIHQCLVTGYNDAKRARRLLLARARHVNGGEAMSIHANEYDHQMEALSSAQLAIELTTRRVALNRNLFPDDELRQCLHAVGDYLNGIIDEWEYTKPSLAEPLVLSLAQLSELDAFLKPPSASARFRDGFKIPFDRALRLMEQAIAEN